MSPVPELGRYGASLTRRGPAGLAVLTGLLVALSYPPFHLLVVPFVALVPLLLGLEAAATEPAGPRRGARLGLWAGLSANGLVLYWIAVALYHFTPLAFLGYLASVVVLALWWSAVAGATVWLRRRTGLPLWAIFPLLWTAAEWGIAHQGDLRFPWLGLGTALTGTPTLVQWADVAGARGVTLWVAWVNAMLAGAMSDREAGKGRRDGSGRLLRWPGGARGARWAPGAAVAVGMTFLLAIAYGVYRERTLPLRPVTTVAVIQPNIGFREKWDPAAQESVAAKVLRLSRAAAADGSAGLVAWPEAALPGFFFDHQEWDRAVGELARSTRTPLLVGALDLEFRAGGSYDYYNAAFLVDSDGSRHSQPPYRKNYLVPVTERVPLVNPRWFSNLRWFGGFARGRDAPVYRIGGGSFGVLICYESAFEDLSRRYRRAGADFLVNITNDAWFGRTSAPYQHAAHLVMRAIENRVGVARAANTGISEFVDPLGRVHLATPLFVERVRASTVLTTGGRTPYVRLGDWVGALALAGTAALAIGAALRGRRGAER